MARVGGKDTKPELIVRSLLHRMGFRFRLHRRDLPGKPDITLPKYKKVIFVHGCFWHGHKGCARAKRPSTNKEFWNEKLNKNFFDLINGYRVEEAKEKLSDFKEEQTILGIGFEVGFNSKSAFNRVFKKFTQMTPSEFRKKHRPENPR